MNMVSYRGPGMAGGLSSGLSQAWKESNTEINWWWHMNQNQLIASSNTESQTRIVNELENQLIEDHYRFCNEFIWPIMHDLPENAIFHHNRYKQYRRFNTVFGHYVSNQLSSTTNRNCFVQDYQLALVPSVLRRINGTKIAIFWHIPWPQNVKDEHVAVIADLARGLLNCDFIGFHTQEYADNFSQFVRHHLHNCSSEKESGVIRSSSHIPNRALSLVSMPAEEQARVTQLLVAPLAIDHKHWQTLAKDGETVELPQRRPDLPMILSVDRADYTKGVTNRLEAIEVFFEKYPHWRGKAQFVQLCSKTRAGIEAFDSYWSNCETLANKIIDRWSASDWQPVVWHQSPVNSAKLATLYRDASIMLVNPVRDGLNLTAKEYVACQSQTESGVLALSPGAGVWAEFGDNCIGVYPESAEQMADAINMSLSLSATRKSLQMQELKNQLKSHTLSEWWALFDSLLAKPNITTLGSRRVNAPGKLIHRLSG